MYHREKMEVKMAGQVSIAHKGTFREHSPLGIIGAASGALIAAFTGAVLWGQLAVWTGSELAWLAIGIGVIAGLVTRLLASNEQNVSIQLLAASAALVGACLVHCLAHTAEHRGSLASRPIFIASKLVSLDPHAERESQREGLFVIRRGLFYRP